jgi:ribonucleoside-diphosphate reductase alpha chain
MKTLKARDLWEKISYAAWASADPGLHFNTTMNDWHTSPAEGPIRASNPCSEYMFLDDTACNLASLNLLQFKDAATKRIDITDYEHAVRLWTVVLEVSVMMAQFPSRQDRRTLLRIPHARPRLRQHRRPADVHRAFPMTATRPAPSPAR